MTEWDEMKAYVGFDEADAVRLRALLPFVEERIPAITDRFYARIEDFEQAKRVFKDAAQVERLKGSLARWIHELLQGPHDDAYWQRRQRIGDMHVKVGLPERYVFTAMNLIRAELTGIARETLASPVSWDTTQAISRITDLELAVMSSTYLKAHETKELHTLRDAILKSLPITIVCLDRAGRVTAATRPRAGLVAVAASNASGRVTDYLPLFRDDADVEQWVEQALRSGNDVMVPRLVVGRGAAQRYFRLTIIVLRHPLAEVLVQIEELTDAVHAEVRMEQAEALAQIGRLAANVAHEIRNPLTSISATLQVIGASLGSDDRRKPIIEKVGTEVLRLNRLVSDLLGFARSPQPVCREADLVGIVREAAQIATVPVEIVGKGPVPAWIDPQLVQQILVNLFQNARDAAGPAGHIVARVGPGPKIEVLDSGPGIPEDARPHLFEAFFTTKTKGTGLGLAISRKFVEAMGGTIELGTEEPTIPGAHFVLTLPAAP
jgi:signal transduction histidine kinase/truncated hemoglobin YjbI